MQRTGPPKKVDGLSMTFLDIATNVIGPVVVVIAISALVARRVNPNPRTISSITLYLFVPFLVLDGMATSQITLLEFGQITAVMTVLSIVLILIGSGVSRLLGFDRKLESAFFLTILLMNAANYGLPLNEFAFGEVGYQYAMVYYVVSIIMTNTFGVFLASRGSASIRQAVFNVFKMPMLYGLIAGLAISFGGLPYPLPAQRIVSLLGQGAVPAMMALLGVQLTRARLQGRLKPIFLASGMRLVLAPVLAAGITVVFGLGGMGRQVTIVQSAMPTAIISGALATEFGSDGEFTTAVILVSTILSVPTLWILLSLVG